MTSPSLSSLDMPDQGTASGGSSCRAAVSARPSSLRFDTRGSREQRSRSGCWMGLALGGPVHSAWAPGQFRAMMCIGISEREFMRGPPAATELPTRRRIRAPRMTAGGRGGPPFSRPGCGQAGSRAPHALALRDCRAATPESRVVVRWNRWTLVGAAVCCDQPQTHRTARPGRVLNACANKTKVAIRHCCSRLARREAAQMLVMTHGRAGYGQSWRT